jgi:deoxyhypusine synthase
MFEFNVKIEADNNEEARKVLLSMFDIMKTIRKETSTGDFIEFGEKLKAKPSLVKKAQLFI